MEIRQLASPADLETYERHVKTHPQASLWQSLTWKKYQEALGRETRVYAAFEGSAIVASALVVIDRTVLNLATWDIPRGPLGTVDSNLLDRIAADAKKDRCIALYLSPFSSLQATAYKLQTSPRHEQPEATRIINLTLSDTDILAQMHQKGRYNIKVAEKNGVRVERSDDARAFGELLRRTAARDGFSAAPVSHYEKFLKHVEGSFLLLAYPVTSNQQTSKPIAGLLGVIHGNTCIYYYGASDYEHRALMAPYLLQWEAMKIGKAAGCTSYDLLGVAPPESSEDHPWQGISRFKEKFGGTVIVYPREQQMILKRTAYAALGLKRRLLG